MPEKLAIVAIDAGSDVRAKYLDEPVIGTSSGKGKFADAFRAKDYLAMDRGRGFRTITYAASEEGVGAAELDRSGLMEHWNRDNSFGFTNKGIDFNSKDIPDEILHGRRISKLVAGFGELASVRDLMKEKTVGWIDWARNESNGGLVAIDGREIKELVDEGIQAGEIPDAELAVAFSMIVNPVEAARRRMASRGEIDYADPEWFLSPGLMDTVMELRDRAIKDEDRELDSVGLPSGAHKVDIKFIDQYFSLRGDEVWNEGLGFDWKIGSEVLFNTTGIPELTVQRAGLAIVQSATGIQLV